MISEILVDNGFSKKEAQVYLAVLEAGEIAVSIIAAKTSLKRSTVYSVVDALKIKGILSINKRHGIQYISALSPRILVDRFKKCAHMAEQCLPKMLEMLYSSPLKPRIQFFEDMDGIKKVLREFSYSKSQSFGFTDYEQMPKELFEFIREEVIPERKKHKNRAQLVVTDNETNRKIMQEDGKSFTEHRIGKLPIQNNYTELLLYGECHTALLSFKKEEMFAVIIDSPALYNTLKNIFLLIWSTSEEK